jgi:hypothetical protein
MLGILHHLAAFAAFSFFFILEKLHTLAATRAFDFEFLFRTPVSVLLSGTFMHFVLLDFFRYIPSVHARIIVSSILNFSPALTA